MTGPLQALSLFAGIGAIDLAARRAGIHTRLMCEIDAAARRVLAHHYPDAIIHDDVRTLTADDARAADLVPDRTVATAGWPCQGNSVAGGRGGMADARSGLWVHVARLLAEFRPAWFVGENVPGLLSVNGGRDFATVVQDLADLGYGVAWRVVDARYAGVPQRRRRVVVVGHLGDAGAGACEVLFEPEGVCGDSAAGGEAWPGAATGVGGGADRRGVVAFGHTNGIDLQADPDVYPTLRAGHDAMPSVAYVAEHVTALTTRAGATYDDQQTGQLVAYPMAVRGRDGGADLEIGEPGDPMFALRAGDGSSSRQQLVAVHENQRGELTTSDTTTLNTGGGKPGQGYPAVTDGMTVRRLTPLECERLQGLPDGWTDIPGASDSQRYRQLGNSVAVPVFTPILHAIARADANAAERVTA